MTQEVLDMVVHAYCDGRQEFIGDYEIGILPNPSKDPSPFLAIVVVTHKDIENVDLPWNNIDTRLKPKAQAEVVIELVKQIFENGDQWLKDEEDYEADKVAERWDNERKSNLEN